jgi:hypothetical protein
MAASTLRADNRGYGQPSAPFPLPTTHGTTHETLHPVAVGATPTFTPGASIFTSPPDSEQYVNIALDVVTHHPDVPFEDDLGEDQLLFVCRPSVDSKTMVPLGDNACVKTLSALNRFLASPAGRASCPTRDSAAIERNWKFFGSQVGKTNPMRTRYTFHVAQRARLPDTGLWRKVVRRDGDVIWLVCRLFRDKKKAEEFKMKYRVTQKDGGKRRALMLASSSSSSSIPSATDLDLRLERKLAAAKTPVDPAYAAYAPATHQMLGPGEYWQYVPVTTKHNEAPPSQTYVCGEFIGHAVRVGKMHRVLEGDTKRVDHNARLAVEGLFKSTSPEKVTEALTRLPQIEVMLLVR